MTTEIAIAIGLGMAFVFGAGVVVSHALDKRNWKRRVCSIVSAEDHRNEGVRLLHEALSQRNYGSDNRYEHYLRMEAFHHFQLADILENGPYKT